MTHSKALTALSLLIAICGAPSPAFAAGHHGNRGYHMMTNNLTNTQRIQLRAYQDYELREPCQNYRTPPAPFIRMGCNLIDSRMGATAHPVIASYTVHFNFNQSGLRKEENLILARVSYDIEKFKPYEVTVRGHADRSGTSEYNLMLSKKRAMTVSGALQDMGIPNRIIDEQAYGEEDPAVPTPDGVRLEENRRVVIEFRE